MKKRDYWIIRSKKYDQLKWVKDKYLLDQFIKFCNLKSWDAVHEIGCGTGIVSKAIKDKVGQVIASDNAIEMLVQLHREKKIISMCMDLENEWIWTKQFDKIIARMVFHHIEDLLKGFDNCYKMLRQDGWLIIQEGIPPSNDKKVIDWYSYIMGLKEKRHTFLKQSLKGFLEFAGFRNKQSKIIIDKEFSVTNWLSSSGQNKKLIKKIYDLHKNAPDYIKKAYKMKIKKDGEIIIQTKVLLIKGQR